MFNQEKKTPEEIFGVKKECACGNALFNVTYEDGTQSIYQDEDGNYLLSVNVGEAEHGVLFGVGRYETRENLSMPISPEGVRTWAEQNLFGEEYEAAIRMVGESSVFNFDIVWERRSEAPGTNAVYECLGRISPNEYLLCSTEDVYPFCQGSTVLLTDAFEGDVYTYYIPKETAIRWAEAVGMDEKTYVAAFADAKM